MYQASAGVRAPLPRFGLAVDDIGLWELNEAFSVQVIYCQAGLPRPVSFGFCVRAHRSAFAGSLGQKAFHGYLGDDVALWRKHDAVGLIEDGAWVKEILVDQGEVDPFLDQQLRSNLLIAACHNAGIALSLNLRPGYDHSYYFISTFMRDQLRWHAERLGFRLER